MAAFAPAVAPKNASQPAGAGDVQKPTQHVGEVEKILLATVGAAVVAYLGYRLARRKDDRGNFLAAGAKFREAFAADIAAINDDRLGHLNLMDYLRSAHDERHAAAVAIFEPFLSAKQLTGFRGAWARYRYGENDDGSPASTESKDLDHDELYFLCYSESGRLMERVKNKPPKQHALERLQALLSHASDA